MSTLPPVTVVYHADCPDGFGAAYGAWLRFGDTARYLPMHHGESCPEEAVQGRQVFILDFSFAPEQLEILARQAASVLQLDHHATARDAWAHVLPDTPGLQCHSHPSLPLKLCFDMDKSGVRLAWEHFHPEQPMPLALQHVEDQDLWRFRLADTKAFCRALRLQAFDFAAWHQIITEAATPESPKYRDMCACGAAIDSFLAGEVIRLADSPLVREVRLPGEPADPLQARRHGQPLTVVEQETRQQILGLAINTNSLFTSELGEALAQRSGTFGLIWQVTGQGQVKASLRARGQVNVARIAEQFGGGGHPNAAAFRMSLARFSRDILGISEEAAIG